MICNPNPSRLRPSVKPPTKNKTVTLMDHLQRDAAADRIVPAALRLLDIEQHLRDLLPSALAGAVNVCQLHDGELLLSIQSAALATKLRQALPRLQEGLTGRGWKVSSILLTVQPAISANESGIYRKSEAARGIPRQALVAWSEILGTMPEGELSRAVENLLAHHGAAPLPRRREPRDT
jgi:hypothetical protein